MATNTTHVGVPPERVFAVLADPRAYDEWVAGARRIRDHTEVLNVSAPTRLTLLATSRRCGA